MKEYDKNYYLGLDIGTNSVGYAVTDKQYELLKNKGIYAWGSHLFEEGKLSAERRSFRTARRRLERRKQRVILLQEIFAKEISKVDDKFYIRLKESALWPEDSMSKNSFFDDVDYKDREYHNQYPTIHHLIMDLIENENVHDVRLVYLACAWLVAHRGHFLNNVSEDNIEEITSFDPVYDELQNYFSMNGMELPWDSNKKKIIAGVLKEKISLGKKFAMFKERVMEGKALSKEVNEEVTYNQELFVRLLCGSKVDVAKLFGKDEYQEIENKSISLGMEEEKFAALSTEIGEDYALIDVMRKVYDWSVLDDILNGNAYISKSKIAIYNEHQDDLKNLKYIIKKYAREKYNEIFRTVDKGIDNYVKYSGHYDNNVAKSLKLDKYNISTQDDFCAYIKKIFEQITVFEEDQTLFDEIKNKLEIGNFMPKQKTSDNRVIPKQLYYVELRKILKNASAYLPFLLEKDANGLSNEEKILSVFDYKLPYYVGPLNGKSSHAWIVKKGNGKILPWNIDKLVDLDASEQAFIKKMINYCSYIPGAGVLPKDSMIYQKYIVLNTINNLRVNNIKISVENKQKLFKELFLTNKRVTGKKVKDYLVNSGIVDKDKRDTISGIDDVGMFSLSTYHYFKNIIDSKILSEEQVENIVNRAAYSEDKGRLKKYIMSNFPQLSEEDVKYILKGKFKEFGRLSMRLLNEVEGCSEDGELMTIMSALWNTNDNLMELLSDRYTFSASIEKITADYYREYSKSLTERLDEMYVSNAVKRQIIRTLDVVDDVQKIYGAPAKIFVEMARGGEKVKKRSVTRKNQLLNLYKETKDFDVREMQKRLEDLGERADNMLQGDKLFLYFCQMGKCMYSGEPIDVEKLLSNDGTYNIEHIYPQAYVKDDSILNNEILVDSRLNGQKSDTYPVNIDIQDKMKGYWYKLFKNNLITEEKFKRLVRTTPFSNEEKLGFINRQLVETSQATKAVATLLKETFPETKIVYVKAGLVSQYRQEYGLVKSRIYNDLHHAKDAYLNIVVGNVYNEKFTKKWFSVDDKYSLHINSIFKNPIVHGEEIVWNGWKDIDRVNAIAIKNTANCTVYSFCRHGGLFDQMPLKAKEGLISRKKGLDTTRYGGYDGRTTSFFILAKYKSGKKYDLAFVPIEVQMGLNISSADVEKQLKLIDAKATEMTLPFGMRKIKFNTMINVDGFLITIVGGSIKDPRMQFKPISQFVSTRQHEEYLKRIDNFVRKITENKNYIYDERYDLISVEKNVAMYDLYVKKINAIYSKRPGIPKEAIINKRDVFAEMDIKEQSQCLMNIHLLFTREYQTDLKLLKEGPACARLSLKLSNWKYDSVKIIDITPSGLHKKESINLKDLI